MIVYRLRLFGLTIFSWEIEAVDIEVISNVGGQFDLAETPPEEDYDEDDYEESGFGFRLGGRR